MRHSRFPLPLLLALCACSGEAGADQPLRTAGEVPRWSIAPEPVVRLGTDDGDGSLHQVTSAVRLADGRIAVANAGSQQVRIFGRDGRLVRNLGRVGAGPGEFRFPAWMGRRGDTLVVWDVISSRISRFSPEGTFVGATTLPGDIGTFPQVVGQYRDGSILVATDLTSSQAVAKGGTVVRGQSALLRVTPRGELADTVVVVPASEQYASRTADGRGIRIESLPFGRRTVLALSSDVLYVGTGEDARIRTVRGSGELADFATVPANQRRVTSRDVEEYWEKLITTGARRHADGEEDRPPGSIPYPDALPPYASLNVDQAGRLWVAESLLPREWDEPGSWWIFSPAGKLVATIQLPPRILLLDIGEDWILAREMGPENRELVSLYAITPA